MRRRDFLEQVAAVTAATVLSSPAHAAFPARPLTYIIPFPPGGESDIGARLQQGVFRRRFGQELVIEAKPGAGGAVAWAQLNNYPGDGYTIMGTNVPTIVLQPVLGKVAYRTEDLTNVHFYQYTPSAIVVRTQSPFKSLDDLIGGAKNKPGKVSLGGSGALGVSQLTLARLDAMAGMKSLYVPFKGSADSAIAMLGGHVDAAMTFVTTAVTQRSKTRVLAVATQRRHPAFPEVPTFSELGFDLIEGNYRGIAVPRSTTEELRQRLSSMFSEINHDQAFGKQLIAAGFELVDITYDHMAAFMQERTVRYRKLAKEFLRATH
jgi:tripartite-type tricarboxylate transporter receptor subunit TctC